MNRHYNRYRVPRTMDPHARAKVRISTLFILFRHGVGADRVEMRTTRSRTKDRRQFHPPSHPSSGLSVITAGLRTTEQRLALTNSCPQILITHFTKASPSWTCKHIFRGITFCIHIKYLDGGNAGLPNTGASRKLPDGIHILLVHSTGLIKVCGDQISQICA